MRAPDLLPPFNLVQNTLSIHYHSLNTLTNLPRNIYWFTFICYVGFVSSTFFPDNEGVILDELDSLTADSPGTHGDPDVLGYSQLGGAPLGISQQHRSPLHVLSDR